MKVNITGKGIIPGLGTIPPIYGKDLSEVEITRILNFPNLRVYAASSGAIITKNNVKNFFHLSVEEIIKKAEKLGIPTEVEPEDVPVEINEEKPITDAAVPNVVSEDKIGESAVGEVESTEEGITTDNTPDDETITENKYNGSSNNQNKYNNKKKNKKH